MWGGNDPPPFGAAMPGNVAHVPLGAANFCGGVQMIFTDALIMGLFLYLLLAIAYFTVRLIVELIKERECR